MSQTKQTEKSQALATPVKVAPPARTGNAGRGPASDILAAWDAIKDTREEWFLVASNVANPNRYFDAFKALGGRVQQHKTGQGGTDVYVQIPAGGPQPHLKPSRQNKKVATPQGVAA